MEELVYPKYRWFVLLCLCIVQAVAVMVLISPNTMIGEISDSMGIDMGVATQITMVVITIFIGISAFLGGGIVDRLGAYWVWTGCSILFIIGSLLIPVIGNNLWGMLFIRLIQGFGAGPVMATIPLVAAQWFPPKERGIVLGIQGSTVPLGAIVSMMFIPFVFQKTGSWQAALAWLTIFLIPTLILSIIILIGPEPPFKEARPHHDNLQEDTGDIKRVYRLPATWAAILCSLWFSWDIRVFIDVITNYLVVDPPVGIGLGPLKAGGLMSGVNAVLFIAAIASGIILEKVFMGRIRRLMMLAFALPAVLWYSIKFPGIYSNIYILSACMWIGAFGIALTSPLIMTFFAKNYPEGIMGKLGGLIIVFNNAGTLVGTGIGSYTLSVTGHYDIAIGLVSAGALLGLLSATLLKEPASL